MGGNEGESLSARFHRNAGGRVASLSLSDALCGREGRLERVRGERKSDFLIIHSKEKLAGEKRSGFCGEFTVGYASNPAYSALCTEGGYFFTDG